MRATPSWARPEGPRIEDVSGQKLQTEVLRDRLLTRHIGGFPLDPEDARREFSDEQRGLRMPSKAGRRWKAVAAFDERVEAVWREQEQLRCEAEALHARASTAESSDEQRLAAWHQSGRKGERPEPEKPELERRLERIEEDGRALDRLIDSILSEKSEHVERHRSKLVREAESDVTKAHERYLQLVRDLEAARAEMLETRRTRRWAAHFPDPEATSDNLIPAMVAGGLLTPVRETLGLTQQLPFHSVLSALAADADTLAAGAKQDSDEPLDPHREAIWEASEEGQAAMRLANKRIAEGLKPKNTRAAGWET